MKLSYEDKVQIYELRKQGQSFKQLSKRFGVDVSGLKYMVKLIDRYGIEIVKKGKNRHYSSKLKQEMMDKALLEGCSQRSISLDYALPNQGMLSFWPAQYKKNGYTIVEKTRGRPAKMGRKRKYSSYQGEIGKKAENLIQRQFEASRPMEKCYTDVTEFAIPNSTQKLYLSPVLDGFNSEIIAYHLSTSPNLEQVKSMLEQAFTEKYYENTILHSDQGWQYQHDSYHRFLESKGIQASMSRKGNSPDNGMMESFFGILKSEMFYGYEKNFRSLENLEQAIVDYIDYYNNKRIKVKLKGLSSVQYRTKSFG
ncbi:IS861 transposase Orf2 [Streptococcus pneumoniae]|uniref:IS3 family transposase n=1 Tax=Streptococcus pneumoniae TaxID=1313 RepID=UPI000B596197|nr:IS3 family transposase [Streptococcus pneumoniae]SNI13962.1 IS861 transposase Orf2 [Streptococcus pneumoniae]